MVFKGDGVSLTLEIACYEFPADGGLPGSDDRNWLVLKATYQDGEFLVKDSNSCLLTYELRELTAGLKVLASGVKDSYRSSFVEPYFEMSAEHDGTESFVVDVAFALPNTMEDFDTAEVECVMTKEEMAALITELEERCERFPDRA